MEAKDGIAPNGKRTIPLPDHLFHTKKIDTANNGAKYDIQELQEALKAVPFSLRQTYQETAARLGIPKSTVHWLIKKASKS